MDDDDELVEDYVDDDDDHDHSVESDDVVVVDDEDDDDDDDDAEAVELFDPELPTRHSYLGESSLLSGGRLLDEDSMHELVILSHMGNLNHVILMPGQTMPLTLFHPVAVAVVQHLINTTKTFGLLFKGYDERQSTYSECDVGVTAEMLEYRAPSHALEIGFKIKIRGRQRFKVLSSRYQADGTRLCTVKILPEIRLPSNPLHCVRLRSLDKFRTSNTSSQCYLDGDNIPEDKAGSRVRRPGEVCRGRMVSRCESMMSPLPSWCFAMYDASALVSEAHSLVSQNGVVTDVPTDPVELSFWIPLSFPIDDRHLIKLLRMNSAIQRLRYQICLLRRYQVFRCRVCGIIIGRQTNIFSMNREGPQSAYVNAGGHVHETLTLRRIENANLIGNPSTEFSWFPGYSWTIAQCTRCTHHLGWKFLAVQSNLKPRRFYGVSRRSILPALEEKIDENDHRFRPVM